MTTQHPEDKRSLQDDRAELEVDPHAESPLTEGEGAPLAQDGVPQPERPVTTQALLGGAPVAISLGDVEPASSTGNMTASGDRPIND